MKEVIHQWATEIRGSSREKTLAAEQAVRDEISRLQMSIDLCSNLESLKNDRSRMEAEVQHMEKELRQLRDELSLAQQELMLKRQAVVEADLREVESALRAHKCQHDQQTLLAAATLLPPSCDPMKLSAAQLQHALAEGAMAAKVRQALNQSLLAVHQEASRQQQSMDRAAELDQRLKQLDDELDQLKQDLTKTHGVDPSVVRAIEELSPYQASRLRGEFLEPLEKDAVAESGWGLPEDVLKTIGSKVG